MRVDFNFLQKEKPLPGLCCLYLLPNKLVVTHALPGDQRNPKATITFIETSHYEPGQLKFILEKIVKKHGLQSMICSCVLHNSYYQIFLLDAPAVAETEIAQALRWQIKELINFPAEDAVIQYFLLSSTLSDRKKIYVVVSKKTALQEISNIISSAGLNLKYIDIPELALRNISALYGDELCYRGLLAFNQDYIEFIITQSGNYLVSRRLALPNNINVNDLPSEWVNNLTTEIQRSFVYAKSHYHQELPEKLLVLTTDSKLVAQLNQSVGIDTEQFIIREKINVEFLMNDDGISLDNLIAIGGALRSE